MERTEINGFTVEIDYDYDADSPRDEWHSCEMVMGHRRYDFPNDAGISFDDFGGWREVNEKLLADGALVTMRIYMIDHSGIALSASEWGNPYTAFDPGEWDSGQVGIAYVTPENWRECHGTEWTGSDEQVETAKRMISASVTEYGQYVNGEVYYYTITDPRDGEVVESCGGFIGYEFAEEAAREAAEGFTLQVKCTGHLNRLVGIVEHDRECPIHPDALEKTL